MERYQEAERSIIKKFRKSIWAPFVKAIKEYHMINENDKIMVCISGGKDSFLLAKCIQEVQRHGDVKFDARFVCMDPGYKEENRKLIEDNAKLLNIPIEFFQSNIFDVVSDQEKSPCYLCARMRRGCLYGHAKEIGCNKIALGHHMDDVIETTMLNLFYGCEIKTMMPKLHSDNFEGLELIRPLYNIREEDIISWKNYNELRFLNCACRFTEESTYVDPNKSKRKVLKNLIKELKKDNDRVDYNIFKALDNVNIDCVLGIKKNKEYKSFLEDYEEE